MERNGIYRNKPEYTRTRQNDAGMDKNGTGTSQNDTGINYTEMSLNETGQIVMF